MIDKTSDAGTAAVLGQTITYTFTIKNTGNTTLHDLTVSDPLIGLSAIDPATVATLAAGKTATLTATYVVIQSDMDAGKIVNSATGHAKDPGNHAVTSGPSTLTVPTDQQPLLKLTKRRVGNDNLALGSTVTYEFRVENTGNVTLTAIAIHDAMIGLSPISPLSVTSLAVGDHVEFTATYRVTQADIDAGKIENTATATGILTSDNSVVTSNQSPVEIILTQHPGIKVTKTSDVTAPVFLGQTITYTFTVENTGDTTLHTISVADELTGISAIAPATFAALTPHTSTTFSATYKVTQADIDNGSIHNEAIASGTPSSSTTPIYSDPSTLDITAKQTPAMTLTKARLGSSPLVLGSTITWQFVVTNSGTVSIDAVTIADTLAAVGPVTSGRLRSPGARRYRRIHGDANRYPGRSRCGSDSQ